MEKNMTKPLELFPVSFIKTSPYRIKFTDIQYIKSLFLYPHARSELKTEMSPENISAYNLKLEEYSRLLGSWSISSVQLTCIKKSGYPKIIN